jgi:enterochelin esterase family protein
MWMGFRLPHIFGNVISQAASLWWGPGYRIEIPRHRGGYQPGWLIDQYETSPRLPVRFWLEIGLMEHPTLMIAPNRRMKAVLESKGNDVIYSEPAGGHDTALWRGTLATALAAMMPATPPL